MGKSIKTIALIAVAVFAPYAAAALGLSGFAATAFSFVLSTAANAIIGGMGSDNPGAGGGVQDSGMLLNKQGNVSAIPLIYGARRIGGTRVYIDTTDSSGATSGTEFLHMVVAFGTGGTRADGTDSLKDITAIRFNDRVAWTPSGIDSYFTGLITVRGWLGKRDQTVASPDITAGSFPVSADWTANHRMRGVAYIYVICKYDRDKLPGAPSIQIETSGKRIQDVSALGTFSDTTAIMNNPANILYDYLTDTTYGKGLAAADINTASFIAAKTYAVSAGLTFNGALSTAETIYNNTQKLIGCGNMNLVYVNGEYYVQPVKQESFTGAFNFNTSNILGKWQIALGNKRSRFNTMKVNFFNPAEEWQTDTVLIQNATYLAADSGVVNEKTIELPLLSDKTLATKVGTYFLNVSRYQTMISFKSTWEALQLQVGDPVTITHEVPGFTLEKFRVNSITLNPDSTVEVILEAYAPDSVYLENN